MLFERLASRVLYADGRCAPTPTCSRANTLGQEGLWAHGISGDLPILLVRVVEDERYAAGPAGAPGPGVLAAQGPERGRRDPQRASHRATSTRCTRSSRPCSTTARGGTWKHRPGGGVPAARRPHGEGGARPCSRPWRAPSLSGDRGDARAAARASRSRVAGRRRAEPSRRSPASSSSRPRSRCRALAFAERPRRVHRRRSRVRHRARRRPGDAAAVGQRDRQPAFGTVVTASGAAHTWSVNSRENRLTPFANDPVTDPTAEAIFVRDDETGEVWSPTPGPMPRTPASGRS